MPASAFEGEDKMGHFETDYVYYVGAIQEG